MIGVGKIGPMPRPPGCPGMFCSSALVGETIFFPPAHPGVYGGGHPHTPACEPNFRIRHMPTTHVNGIQLYYEEYGKGFPIVLAHGAGGNHMSWWQQVPDFARNYRCITFDHRGWGLSVDTDDLGPSAFTDDLG